MILKYFTAAKKVSEIALLALLTLGMFFSGCVRQVEITETEAESESYAAKTVPEVAEIEKYERGDVPRVYISTYSKTENYAVSAEIAADSESDEGNPIEYAADGDDKTYWVSDLNPEQNIYLDFGKSCEFAYVKLEWGKGAPKTYDVMYSSDGEIYTLLKNITDGSKYKINTVRLEEKVSAQYVKICTYEAASEDDPYYLEEITVCPEEPEKPQILSSAEYKQVEIAIVDKEGGSYKTIEETAMIKIRGNSTANTAKNPYNIKFEKKQRILGIKGTRKWVLLANLFDKTLMRNKLAYDFAAAAGVSPALESRFVEVYLDGEYEGSYTLSLPVTDGVVDIDVEKGEMLFERNGYYNKDLAGVNYNYTPVEGIRFVPIAPEKGTETEKQKQEIKNLLSRVEYAAISGDRERIESVIDVDSFVNMYICEELMKDIDIYHGSTYFYYKNSLLYSGPIWDMDLSMGNVSMNTGYSEAKYADYSNMYINNHKYGTGVLNDSTTGIWAQVDFYAPLMKADWFAELVRERYIELIPLIESMYSEGGMIDSYLEEAGASFERNYSLGGYSLTEKYFDCEYDEPYADYMENVEFLKNWLYERDMWLRGYFKIK